MRKVIMKCSDCPWELITFIEVISDWGKLDNANWEKSKHVSDNNHIVIIKEETVFSIKKL